MPKPLRSAPKICEVDWERYPCIEECFRFPPRADVGGKTVLDDVADTAVGAGETTVCRGGGEVRDSVEFWGCCGEVVVVGGNDETTEL